MTSYQDTILTFDLTNPDLPTQLDSIALPTVYEIFSVAVVGDVAFAATTFELFAVDISDPSALTIVETYDTIEAVNVGNAGDGMLAVQTWSDGTLLGDFSDLGAPILAEAPEESRWWETGRIMGDVWLRPSGPFLDIVSLECRAPEADFRWWGLGQRIWFENLGRYRITSWSWDFGDGTVSTPPWNTVDHDYEQPGRYTVSLEVVGPNRTDTTSMVVEVGTRIFFDDFETSDTIGWD